MDQSSKNQGVGILPSAENAPCLSERMSGNGVPTAVNDMSSNVSFLHNGSLDLKSPPASISEPADDSLAVGAMNPERSALIMQSGSVNTSSDSGSTTLNGFMNPVKPRSAKHVNHVPLGNESRIFDQVSGPSSSTKSTLLESRFDLFRNVSFSASFPTPTIFKCNLPLGHQLAIFQTKLNEASPQSKDTNWSWISAKIVGPSQGTGNAPFQPLVENEQLDSDQKNSFLCICFQEVYQSWSMEEHRLADYIQGRRYDDGLQQADQQKQVEESFDFPSSMSFMSTSKSTPSGSVIKGSFQKKPANEALYETKIVSQPQNRPLFGSDGVYSHLRIAPLSVAAKGGMFDCNGSSFKPAVDASPSSQTRLSLPSHPIFDGNGVNRGLIGSLIYPSPNNGVGGATPTARVAPGTHPTSRMETGLSSDPRPSPIGTSAFFSTELMPNLTTTTGLSGLQPSPQQSAYILSNRGVTAGPQSVSRPPLKSKKVNHVASTNNKSRKRSVSDLLALPDVSSMFKFDPRGARIKTVYQDILLEGNVTTSSMAQASPVWAKLFSMSVDSPQTGFPAQYDRRITPTQFDRVIKQELGSSPTITSTMPRADEVDFSEDDGEALWLLLNITHLRFVRIPATLEVDTLCEIAILCDKYDCLHLVQPWLSSWLSSGVEKKWNNSDAWEEREQWLLIAWIFGQHALFNDIARSLILESSTSNKEASKVTRRTRNQLGEPLLPPRIKERITNLKRETIGSMLHLRNRILDRYQGAPSIRCKHNNPACDATVYGSIISGLEKISFARTATINRDQISIQKLANAFSDIRIHVYPSVAGSPNHLGCWKDLKGEVEIILANIPTVAENSHLRYMEGQRRKLSRGL